MRQPITMRPSGFTLVELVVAITVTAIAVSFAAYFVAQPVRGYADQMRRAELVDLAESSLRRLARDVRRALPNSVRTTTVAGSFALELLGTVDGVRYRAGPPPGDTTKQLDFAAADAEFNSVGEFTRIAKPFSSNTAYLSIYNVGVPGADAYELANVITPPGTQIDIDADAIAGEDHVRIAPAFQFTYGSPGQRLYLVEGPVSWLCDPVAGTLTRYTGYAITVNHGDRDTAAELLGAGATAVRIAERVNACAVSYTPGTAQRSALLSARLGVADAGESVTLLHQVHVDNVP